MNEQCAWCDACEQVRQQQGGWNDESEAYVGVTLIRLDKDAAARIFEFNEPIQLRDISLENPKRSGIMLICGFPMEWVTKPLCFMGRRRADEWTVPDDLEYDPNKHIVVDFSRDAFANDLTEVILPKRRGIKGISGCGIWHLTDLTSKGIAEWRPENCKLVAIEHRYSEQSRCVAGTWAEYLVAKIADAFPEFIPSIRLEFFPKQQMGIFIPRWAKK
jgi:hypothetical protein